MDFSDKVYALRTKKGLTQVELAKLVNVSQSMIWQFEKKNRKPTPNTAIQLAKTLGVKLDDLMNDERNIEY